MTTPSDTQSLILSRAATRPGNLALPLPECQSAFKRAP